MLQHAGSSRDGHGLNPSNVPQLNNSERLKIGLRLVNIHFPGKILSHTLLVSATMKIDYAIQFKYSYTFYILSI